MKWPIYFLWTMLIMFVLGDGSVQSESEKREAPVKISGVEFEPAAQVGNWMLPFRGGTLCRHRTFKVYTAALYVSPEHQSAGKILGPVPKRLLLHYHRDISRQDFIDVSEKTLEKNPDIDRKHLRRRINRLYELFQDVREGDRYWLDHIPGEFTELFLNGKSLGRIEGDDFAEAYFGIWLSDHSISEKYRRRIIGAASKIDEAKPAQHNESIQTASRIAIE